MCLLVYRGGELGHQTGDLVYGGLKLKIRLDNACIFSLYHEPIHIKCSNIVRRMREDGLTAQWMPASLGHHPQL